MGFYKNQKKKKNKFEREILFNKQEGKTPEMY